MSARAAVETICPRCWTYTLTGADADRCALTAHVEDRPLTRAGELLAVLDGRATYEVDLRRALYRRDRWALRSPAKGAVYAEHRCNTPIPTHWIKPPAPPAPRPVEVSF